MSSPKMKYATLFLLVLISLQFAPATNSSIAGDDIIITEVLYDTPGTDSDEEWFELFNPTDSTVDLTGWSVDDNYASIGLTGTILAKGYFVVASDAAAFNTLYGYSPDLSLDWGSFALSNSGDMLTLKDDLSAEVDFVAWENEVPGWSIIAVDTTIRRTNVVDTNTVDDWENSGTIGDPGDGPYDEMLLDVIAPIVNITAPVNGSTVSRFVDINVNATDANGIASYAIYVDGGLIATTSSYVWDSRNVNNGSHIISAICKDPANNIGEHNITVIVDNEDLISDIDAIKIMTYNVEESGANPDWKEVVKEENPDIVVFVETGDWDDGSDFLLNQYVDAFNAYFVDEEPYEGYTAQGISYNTGGEAIMSRFPVLESVRIPEVPLDNGTMYDVTHDFMFWNVNISGTEVYLIGVHLKAMGGIENEVRREYETEGIINYMDALGEYPILYMGDLNSFSPEDTGALAPTGDLGYGPLTMMLVPDDPTYGQYSSEVHNFTDIYRTLNPTTPGFTYPSYASRIDFIIANDYFVDYMINSTVGDTATASTGSDHYCVDFFLDAYSFVNELDVNPHEVQGLDAVAISTTEIDLTWYANIESDLDYYRVFRDGVNIANTSNTYYSDSGLTVGTWYDYEITAVDTSGKEGVPSSSVSIRTQDVVPEFLVFGITILCLLGVSALVSLIIFKRK